MPGVRTLAEGFQDYFGWATDPVPRIGFGLPFFDGRTNGGIARSEICMMLAFSSVGKTTLGLNVIRNNPTIPVLFFSLEMNWRMVAARLAAMELPTTTAAIEQQYRQLMSHPSWVQQVVDKYPHLVCDDTPAISLRDAKESYYRATERLGMEPRLVIWDYMELIGGSGLMSKSEQVDKAAEKLRNWTREMDCASLVLHQVGKGDAGGGSEPLALDSGRYGGHAPMDFVIGAYAPRLERGLSETQVLACQDEIYLQLLKNRAGSASYAGKKHRLDSSTLRLSEWNDLQFPQFGPPQGLM